MKLHLYQCMIIMSEHLNGYTMRQRPHIYSAFRNELYHAQLWRGRALLRAFTALTGLTVVCFTWPTEDALGRSLMASTMLASAGQNLIRAPLYSSLAELQLTRLPKA